MMQERLRSPRYPHLSLEKAEAALKGVWEKIGDHAVSRDSALGTMGYESRGAAASSLAALTQYGLLERDRDEYKISARGLALLHARDSKTRLNALRAAFAAPKAYAELKDAFTRGIINLDDDGDGARNWLAGKGFVERGAKKALADYIEGEQFISKVAIEAGEPPHNDIEGGAAGDMLTGPGKEPYHDAPPRRSTQNPTSRSGEETTPGRPSQNRNLPLGGVQPNEETKPDRPPAEQISLQTVIAFALQLDSDKLKQLIKFLELIRDLTDGGDTTTGA